MGQIHPDHVAAPQKALLYNGTFYLPAKADADGRLIVRGEDQLFSYKGVLTTFRVSTISGADGYAYSNPVPAGEIWHVTVIGAVDVTTPTTRHRYGVVHDAVHSRFGKLVAAIAAAEYRYWQGALWLDPTDTIRVDFTGGLVGDSCYVTLTGYIMTKET